MGMMLGLVGPALGAASGIGSLFGGTPASNVQLPPQWQMPNMDAAAGNAFSGIQDITGNNIPGQLLPQYGATAQGLMNNPGAGGAMAGSQASQGYGFNAANQASGAGNYLNQMGQGVTPYAMGVMNMGFDPQSQLYGQQFQQQQQQTRAGLEARGVDNTPYGAGVENTANQNFNTNWENQQLGRAATGLNAGSSALGQGGSLMNMGANLSAMAPGLAQNAGFSPYNTYQQIGNDRLNALNAYSNAGLAANQVPQQGVSDYLQYLGAGNSAAGTANQTAQLGLNQANMGFNQSQQIGNQLGQSFSGLSNGINRMYQQGSGSPMTYGPSPNGGGYAPMYA